MRGCCRIKNQPHKHKLILKIMTDISKNTELQQSCITAVMPSTEKVYINNKTKKWE